MWQLTARFKIKKNKLQAVTLLFPVTNPTFGGSMAQKQDKLLIYMGKSVVGGTGQKPVPAIGFAHI